MPNVKAHKRTDLKKPTWQYDVSVGGKRKRKAGFKTKNEALHAGHTLMEEMKNGASIDKDKTFATYYTEWTSAKNTDNLSQPQQDWYRRAYNTFDDQYPEIRLKDITRQSYQALLNDYGKGRSDETVRKLHGILAQILRDATYDGYIERDPTYKVKVGGTVPGKKESDKYIKIQEYLDLIDYFKSKGEPSYVLLYILAITGARFSEVNRMKHDDLKFGVIHFSGTKTENAYRDVEINQKDVELIKDKLKNHPRRMDGYLFNLSHNAVKRSMNYAKQQIGMADKDKVTTYALRHTHCSYLISKGIPIEYISKRLGHSSISITLDVYSHLLDEHREKQADRVREIFSSRI